MEMRKQFLAVTIAVLLILSVFSVLTSVRGTLYSTSGWELSGGTDVTDAGFWNGTIGSPTVVTTPVVAGTYAMSNPTGSNGVNKTLSTTYSQIYVQTHVNFSVLPSAEGYRITIIKVGKASNWNYATSVIARKNATHVVFCMESGAHWLASETDSNVIPLINADYIIELNRSTTGTNAMYVNGIQILNYSTEYYDADTVQIGGFAQNSAAAVFDSVVISDSYIGTAQTSSSVTLSSPSDLATVYTNSTTFVYTPSCPDAIQNSSLWMNVSGTWQKVADNSSAVTDKSVNNITYTLPLATVYIWNVQVFNTTASVFASANYTLTFSTTTTNPIATVPTTSYTSNKNWSSSTISCQFNDDINITQVYVNHNASGTWSGLITLTPIWTNSTSCWGNYTFLVHANVGTVIGYNWTAVDSSGNWISGNTTSTYTLTVASETIDYTQNAIWIYDQPWVQRKQNILTSNMSGLLNDLGNHSIKYAILFVGYFNGATNQIAYVRSDAIYTTFITGCHARGIKAIAWGEDDGSGLQDIRASNRDNIYATVRQCMYKGFDGYSDDIETYIGTQQDQIDFFNNLTDVVHKMGKIHMPAVAYDWLQNINPFLNVDFIVTMFYSTTSKWEDAQGIYYWQENFGIYGGEHGAPASPLILGIMNYEGFNQYSLPWQLNQTAYAMNKYTNRSMVGFCFWIYEYMAGQYPDDWQQWDYFVANIPTSTPIVHSVTLNSEPTTGIGITYQGALVYTSEVMYTFNISLSLNVSSTVTSETHSSLFGCTDHTGGAGSGWSVYTYANGPYTSTSFGFVNSVYFYAGATGSVKIAIYNSTTYHIDGWVGTDKHPHMLLTQSNVTTCVANTWNLVNLTEVPMYASDYFIVIKISTTGMLVSAGYSTYTLYGEYGHGQYTNDNYATAFPSTFPSVYQFGSDQAAYVPSASISYTTLTFQKWEDDSTSITRTITNTTSNIIVTVTYNGSTVPSISVIYPMNTSYQVGAITVSFMAVGGTIDQYWFNAKNGSDWVYVSNQTGNSGTFLGLISGTYSGYFCANNTLGSTGYTIIVFSISASEGGVTVVIVNTWWSSWW